MKAMVLPRVMNLEEDKNPLEFCDIPIPIPKGKDILLKVLVCGVCHTELDEIEGRTPPTNFPIILGHQVVGRVEKAGDRASRFMPGDRVGVAWIYSACGKCTYCRQGNENLCPDFRATGRDAHGGYAEYMVVPEDFAYAIPERFSDAEAAPLLCAGAIGFRSLKLCRMKDGDHIGLAGFGASAHLVMKMIKHLHPHSRISVFSRTAQERAFAQELGAHWTGDFGDPSPEKLRCIIDTTPAWSPVVESLRNLEQGGRLVINAIRKEEKDKDALLSLDYGRDLWMEKEIKSVANITRKDVGEFLQLASVIAIWPEVQEYRLEDANQALRELRERKIRGAKVLKIA
ncbi:MAG: zinc-dependent alcohol dehydrogenase family protein [bacterium]